MGRLMKRDEPLMRELVDRGLGIARKPNYLIDTHYIGANRRRSGFEIKREIKLFELFYSKSCDGEIIPEFWVRIIMHKLKKLSYALLIRMDILRVILFYYKNLL